MLPDEPWVLGTGETGLTRVFHAECVPMNMLFEDDDEG